MSRYRRAPLLAFFLTILSANVQASLLSAVLPASRSVAVDVPATFFATVLNTSSVEAVGCRVEPASAVAATLTYQRTDATNQPVGAVDEPFTIDADAGQTLVLSLTASQPVDPVDVGFTFICDNNGPAPIVPGLNTLLFSASATPSADMVALAATVLNDGVAVIAPNDGLGFFSVASINLGSAATITATPRAVGAQPAAMLVCETNSETGACLGSPASSVELPVTAGATPTFAVFIGDGDERIPFDPAANRVVLEFLAGGQVNGATSIAVRSATALDVYGDSVEPEVTQANCVGCHVAGGPADDTQLVFTANPSLNPTTSAANDQVMRVYATSVNNALAVLLDVAENSEEHAGAALEPQALLDFATYLELLGEEVDNFALGLETRPSNTTCLAPARSISPTAYALSDAYPSLPDLPQPLKAVQPPQDNSVWYVLGRQGGIDRFDNEPGADAYERYLDIDVTTAGEGGLLSAVFHPDWPVTKELFVSYTLNVGGLESRLSRLVITSDAQLPATYDEEILLTVDQPQNNHNGGDLVIGNDGYLYWGIGDGGGAGDTANNAQTTTNLLGTVLRIDAIDVPFPNPRYTVPSGNPFSANAKCGPDDNAAACPEIFAYGLRNPWRMSVDRVTGLLWTGDVGQGAREEVDIVPEGGNLGWRCLEGTRTFNSSGCPSSGFVDPVYEYPHSNGNGSITGGYVYRGNEIPELRGRYVFADYLTGRVWALDADGSGDVEQLLDASFRVAGFSEDDTGELYVVGLTNGRLFRLQRSGGIEADNVPASLADTGCVLPSDPKQPVEGLIPYAPNAPFWSDGSDKLRWLALPDGMGIDVESDDDWSFPPGTVIVKSFERGARLIETRLFMRHPDGGWAGYSYEWNAQQDAATRNDEGRVVDLPDGPWSFPAQGECLDCHTEAAGFALGPETAQLNGLLLYPSTGVEDNQLEVYNHIDLFAEDVPEPVELLPVLVDPADASADLDARARAYLHTNCSSCHQPGGGPGTSLDLRYATPLAATGTCDVAPDAGNLGIADARIIAPGDPARSVLVARVNRRDDDAMPPLASLRVDEAGVTLLTSWVAALNGCN